MAPLQPWQPPPQPAATISPIVPLGIITVVALIGVIVLITNAAQTAALRRRIRKAEAAATMSRTLSAKAHGTAREIDAFVDSRAGYFRALGRAAADEEWTRD